MTWLLIFLFGGLGALARYGAGLLLPFGPGMFPWAMFLVNAIGSLLIGAAYGYGARLPFSELTLLTVTAGFLGGFTTFSTFSWQSLLLLQQGRWLYALAYIVGSPVAGIVCALIGWLALRRV